ncbi:leucyl aminopeptidase [Candidatus Daviesbacteria bacterium]|nr:leucyl aminopeptidase [Candidatus Daviesbacteria bacterium]
MQIAISDKQSFSTNKKLEEIKDGYLVLPIFEGEKAKFSSELVSSFLKENPKFGKLYEVQLLYSPNLKIVLIGLGKKDKFDFGKLQNFAGAATKYLLAKTEEANLALPKGLSLSGEQIGQALSIGIQLMDHDPSLDYKSKKEPHKLKKINLLSSDPKLRQGLERGNLLSGSINLARKLADMPANELSPTVFLNHAKDLAKANNLEITVLDEAHAKKKGMGAFVGVAQGSDEPSYLIALEYTGNSSSKEKWGLLGKGITFDSGGISIKPSSNMHEMKYDMCGAAAVLATMQVLAKLKVKNNIVGIMAVTENLPGGKAQRPGDIVRTYSGKTAEVLNTDAEGRLVLIDAIAWAQKDFKANKLIDLATLTGAIVISLGDFNTGVFTNNVQFAKQLINAGGQVGEKYWLMPMDEDYDEMIKGEIGDITNIGHGGSMPGAAGSITGAKFIEAGVKENIPWIHLDIAGTAWDSKPKPYRGAGATGVGIKTLVKLIEGDK